MKYICTNPEVLVKEIKENGIYGRDMIMSRINLGKSEPEHGLGARIVNPCLDFAKGLIPEANITEAFSYTYNSSRHNVGHIYVWENLEEIFEIENIGKDENGQTIIKVRYMPAKLERARSKEEKEQAKEKWDKLEEIYQSQGLNSYTDEEINVIVNSVIDKYTEDLAKREDVVIEQSPLAGSIYLGGGTNYYLEDLEYNFNGEKIIVEALTKGDPDAHIEVSECRFPDEKGLMDVTIYRKAKNGKKERLAIVMVDAAEYPEYGKEISCRILKRNYDLHDVLNSFHPWYYYIDPNTDDIKRGEEKRVSEEEFKEFIKDMVLPEKIEKLKEVFWKKMKFVVIDEANPSPKKDIQWGIIERGDWPEELKGQTLNIDLTKANKEEITPSV